MEKKDSNESPESGRNEEFAEFNQELVAVCEKITSIQALKGRRSRYRRHVKAVEPTSDDRQKNLRKALASCDASWAEELKGAGADIGSIDSPMAGGAFEAFWDGASLHDRHDSRRVAATVKWMDDNDLGLSGYGAHYSRKKYSTMDVAQARKALSKGGGAKRAARLDMACDWLALPGEYYGGPENWRLGLDALLGQARSWSEDADAKARVFPQDIIDVWCVHAAKSTSGLIAMTSLAEGLGSSPSAAQWAILSKKIEEPQERETARGQALARALAEQDWSEPLDKDTATRFAALAISECCVPLLVEVLKRTPDIDWTLGARGSELAQKALGKAGTELARGRSVGALHLSRICQAHLERSYHSGDTVSMTKILLEMPKALEQAANDPFPHAFLGCTATEMLTIARIDARLALPDAKGLNIAHAWADEATNKDGIDTVRRLMGSPLAKLVGAADHQGRRPIDTLRKIAVRGSAEALAKLETEFSKWEKTQMSKEVGRKAKAPAPAARRL